MLSKAPLSVVLPVLNEERNLAAALESVAFAGEVFVVDSGSADTTCAIAEAFEAQLIHFDFSTAALKKKAWSLANLDFAHEWVLFLDGDECVTPGLREEIVDVVNRNEASLSGAYVDRDLWFMGRRMRSFSPNWNLRLFRPGRASIEDLGLSDVGETGDNEIHEHFVVTGATTHLTSPLAHNDYRGIGPWIDRHNRYATWEAHFYLALRSEPWITDVIRLPKQAPIRRKRTLRRLWVRLPGRPVLRFLTWYFGRRGCRDGLEGLIFCVLMAWYELLISIKIRELEAAR